MNAVDEYSAKHNIGRSPFVKIKGYTLPERFEINRERINNFNVRNTDIWVVSFPKSGTTWAQEMIWLIINNLNYEGALKENLFIRSPFIDWSSIFKISPSANVNEEYAYIADSLKFIENKYKNEESIVIKTHLPWELLPQEIQNGTKTPKIIYIKRDPKDVCVSYYHHLQKMYSGTFEMFCEIMLAGKVIYTPYWPHCKGFWKRRHQPNILLLTFEEMKKDLPAVIEKVANFLQKPLTKEEISKLTDHLSFENMKNNKLVNFQNLRVPLANGMELKSDNHMRKGVMGSYKTSMTPDMIKKFDDWTTVNLDGMNWNFE